MTRTFHRSFGAGEITPELFARFDLPEMQTGAKAIRNFLPMPSGALRRRPGFARAAAPHPAGRAVRLLPFVFARGEALVLELGVLDTPAGVSGAYRGYMRFLADGALSRRTALPASWTATSYNQGTVVLRSGVVYYATEACASGDVPGTSAKWYATQDPWVHEVPVLWDEAEIRELRYAQSNDVVTFTCGTQLPQDLSRYLVSGVIEFKVAVASFSTNAIAAPTGLGGSATLGNALTPSAAALISGEERIRFIGGHSLLDNDTVVLPTNLVFGGPKTFAAGTYTVIRIDSKEIVLRHRDTGLPYSSAGLSGTHTYTSGKVYLQNDPVGEASSTYVVTALTSDGKESVQSSSTTVTNNLYVDGAYNTLTWTAVSGAARYRVYKRRNNVYGFIGETESNSFVDENVAPDFSLTPPRADALTTSINWKPLAVGYFEQRRVFANSETYSSPRDVWMSRPGSITDFTYHLPTVADDRVYFRLAAREFCSIQHLVSLDQLLILTDSTEFRVSSGGEGALTGTNLVVRPQSYIGCNSVTPLVLNNQVLFAGQRGGHLYALAYNDASSGFATADLCLRAPHLFDGLTLSDLTLQKAPRTVVWAVNSAGQLLSLSYVPGEQVLGWTRHDNATYASCCAIPEGAEDRLYVIATRGSTTQVERMGTDLISATASDWMYADGSERIEYSAVGTVTLTATAWPTNGAVTLSFSTPPSPTLVAGDEVVFADFKVRMTGALTGRVVGTVPVAQRGVALSSWSIKRSQHTLAVAPPAGASVWADGVLDAGATVVGTAVSTSAPATVVVVGLPFTSTVQTLPIAMQVEGLAQGTMKSVSRIWVRTDGYGPYEVRGNGAATPVVGGSSSRSVLASGWDIDGDVTVSCSTNNPLTVVGLAIDVVTQ